MNIITQDATVLRSMRGPGGYPGVLWLVSQHHGFVDMLDSKSAN